MKLCVPTLDGRRLRALSGGCGRLASEGIGLNSVDHAPSSISNRWRCPSSAMLQMGLWILALVVGPTLLFGQNVTQQLPLTPGWNAIFLEVEPENPDPSEVFRGYPIESVWTFADKVTAVDFIQDPNEPIWNRSSWRLWVPTNRVDSFNNNLFRILGNRPYLVNVSGNAAVTLQVTGRPPYRPLAWVPDAYNLRGFSIDATARPSFENFFRSSPAHYDVATSQLQKVYRLNTLGQWQRVAPSDLIEPGVAYWVYTRGGSTFSCPLGIQVSFGDGIDFGASLSEQTFTLQNLSDAPKTVELRDLSGGSNPLAIPVRGTEGSLSWTPLPQTYRIDLDAGGKADVRLSLQRQRMNSTNFSTILGISDANGTFVRIPVTGSKVVVAGSSGSPPANPTEETREHAGLWVGTVTLNAVTEVNSGTLVTNIVSQSITRSGSTTNPTPTRAPLSMRLLVHVDTNGVTRLLKEVIQMWKDGTTTNAGGGFVSTATPGRYVLVTEEGLISQFKGSDLRDGQSVGRRLSTASYDWDGTNSTVVMNGRFAVGNQVQCSLILQPNTPTNPFRHKYHPDHDNLNAQYDGPSLRPEAYAVTRDITLQLAPNDSTAISPDYGYSVIAGVYREKLSGLHRDPIYVNGSFRLTRVSTTQVLNQ